MNNSRIAIAFAVFALNIPAWCAEGDDAAKKALPHLQVDWALISGAADGEPVHK
jgi:hypothetical protein